MKRLTQPPITIQPVTDDGNWTFQWAEWVSRLFDSVQGALPVYADNATATAGGLQVNDRYRTSTGQIMIVY